MNSDKEGIWGEREYEREDAEMNRYRKTNMREREKKDEDVNEWREELLNVGRERLSDKKERWEKKEKEGKERVNLRAGVEMKRDDNKHEVERKMEILMNGKKI